MSDANRQVRTGSIHGSITGVVGIDNVIRDSFNQVQASTADTELRQQLEQLVAAVAEMAKSLAPAEAEAAGRDLRDFTAEATSDKPRKSVLAVLGEGLTSVATAVGQLGAPVIALVSSILTIFNGGGY